MTTDFEKQYFAELYRRAIEAQTEVQAIGKMLMAKYNCPQGTQITPNGEIVLPKEAE